MALLPPPPKKREEEERREEKQAIYVCYRKIYAVLFFPLKLEVT